MTVVAWFWMVGSLFTALLAFIVLDQMKASWNVFALLCALPSTIAAVLVAVWVPKSPRHLALQVHVNRFYTC
jgi:hypothetical protein